MLPSRRLAGALGQLKALSQSLLMSSRYYCAKNGSDEIDLVTSNELENIQNAYVENDKDERPVITYSQKALQTLKLDTYPHYVEREWWKHGARMTFWPTWRTKKDTIRRELVAEYGPDRVRLKAIKASPILPQIIRDECAKTLHEMPKKSIPRLVQHLCQFSGAKRGKLNRFHLHRQIFRNLADHGKLSGVQRAMW